MIRSDEAPQQNGTREGAFFCPEFFELSEGEGAMSLAAETET
jgi:hypothetical protein